MLIRADDSNAVTGSRWHDALLHLQDIVQLRKQKFVYDSISPTHLEIDVQSYTNQAFFICKVYFTFVFDAYFLSVVALCFVTK